MLQPIKIMSRECNWLADRTLAPLWAQLCTGPALLLVVVVVVAVRTWAVSVATWPGPMVTTDQCPSNKEWPAAVTSHQPLSTSHQAHDGSWSWVERRDTKTL